MSSDSTENVSPLESQLSAVHFDLITSFRNYLNFEDFYTSEVEPEQVCGFLAMTAPIVRDPRQPHIPWGIQRFMSEFSCLLTVGGTQSLAHSQEFFTRFACRLDNWFAVAQNTLDDRGIVYELKGSGKIVQSPRQTLRDNPYWVADIATDGRIAFAIEVDRSEHLGAINGSHDV